jgi:ParB family chromosome partitioning protein
MSTRTQQKGRPRLGRGLSSLIAVSELPLELDLPATEHAALPAAPSADATARPGSGPVEIPISSVVPNPHQPRQEFDEAALKDLAASITSCGIIQPIIVRRDGQQYQLVAGERRWRAARIAGLSTIPAIIREVDSITQAQMALIENVQREDLNPLDRANGYRTLIDQLGLTQAELAGRLGEDRSTIANFLRLLDLAEPVKAMVRDGRLSVGHAKLIAGVDDVLEQERLANLVVLQGLSVRNLERIMQERPKSAPPKTASVSPHIQDLEKSISRQLGLRVQVRQAARKGKGRLIIHYATLDQFDELMGRLGVTVE